MTLTTKFFSAFVFSIVLTSNSGAQTFEDFEKSLITNGISWKAGSPTYIPSFYTGFAPRIEDPNRIHFRLSRGNQIRLTAQLDEYSVLTYFYGLLKRDYLVDQAVQTNLIKLEHQDQMGLFRSVLNSERYQIYQQAEKFQNNSLSREQMYEASLKTLEELNPGRVFRIQLNISAAILRWQNTIAAFQKERGDLALDVFITKNPRKTITLINDLVWGRVNVIAIAPALKAKLIETLQAKENLDQKAIELFTLATEGRYNFQVLRNGLLQSSLYQNALGQFILEYPEFTAIYPNGSVRTHMNDRDGNSIPTIRESGVMNFIARDTHDVDHIRVEPYYGYIPKMDYTAEGNGIHNPAVRTYLKNSIYQNLYKDLNIPANDNTLWIVSRGGVSHGCTRMAAGHVLEVRDVFPSSNDRMKKVKYFGNQSEDYDLFDIDGTGQLQVMGVKYFLAYAIVADDGEGYREGAGLIAASLNRDAFYNQLYGQKQFRLENNKYIFSNPYISQFAIENPNSQRGKAYSLKIAGDFNLYEQAYEKDKLQFFTMSSSQMSSLSEANDLKSSGKLLVRLFGRAVGCGPLKAEYPLCNEEQFEKEFAQLLPLITKVK